jgi:hypothetical protein
VIVIRPAIPHQSLRMIAWYLHRRGLCETIRARDFA